MHAPTWAARASRERIRVAVLTCGLGLAGVAPAAWGASEQTQRLIRFNEGVVAFTDARYAAAKDIFSKLVDGDAQDAAALYYLGLTHLQLDEYAPAAEVLARVTRLDPQVVNQRILDEAGLDLALAQVGGEQYSAGKAALERFFASGAGDVADQSIAYFYLGIAEYHLANYDAALKAFDDSERLANDPRRGEKRGASPSDIGLYRGFIRYRQHNEEQATAHFSAVASSAAATDEQKGLARRFLRRIETGAAPTAVAPFEMSVRLGLNYDTNVILLGDETVAPANISNEADFRFGLTSDFLYRIPVGDRLQLGIGGTTFHSWHASIEQFNVQTYAGRFSVSYLITDDLLAGLQYDYDYNFVGNDDFLSRHKVTPSFRLTERRDADRTPRTWTNLAYSYEDRDFFESVDRRLDRDGNYHALTVAQGFNLCQPWKAKGDKRWVETSIGYRLFSASTVGDEFDETSHGLATALFVPLPWELNFEFSGQWTWEDYKQPSLFDFKRKERNDFVQTYVWSLGRQFELHDHVRMELRGDVVLTFDDASTQDRLKQAVFSYERAIYGLSVAFTFH